MITAVLHSQHKYNYNYKYRYTHTNTGEYTIRVGRGLWMIIGALVTAMYEDEMTRLGKLREMMTSIPAQ